MAWSVPDLSSITASLIGIINDAITTVSPPFFISVSGSSPDAVRNDGGCQLSLYLMHVSRDASWRNTPVSGPKALTVRQQPLSLNLSYLLTVFAAKDFNQEQVAMSIVLRAFHEQAIFKTPTEEFTIGVEADSIEEMSRLWQAFAVPIRLSSMFRVAVVFLTPSETPSAPAPPPTKATLTVGANLSPPGPQLFQTATRVTFTNIPPPGTPEDVGVALAPMTFVAGDLITVGGSALDQPSAASVFVAAAGAVLETEVTAWRQAPITSTVLRLALPATYGAPPAATPVPGVYLLSVGSTSPPLRSATIPLMIAARVNNPLAPSALTPDGAGLFTIDGGGFSAPPLTQVVLDSIVLTSTAGAPGDGEFQVNPAGTQIVFRLPTTIAPGRYFVRIRVNGVESPPSFWIDV